MKRENMPAEHALKRLERAVQLVTSVPEACARDPGRDFTRSRKIPLNALVWIMTTWAWDTIGTELEDAYGWDGAAPTASAFCQQRAKLRDDVMPRVSSEFLAMWEQAPLMGRFVLYGVDGTDVQLCPSSDPRTRVRSNKSGAEHNEAHPTTSYDIGRRTFQDMVWQGSGEQNEVSAFCELVDRCPPAFAPDGTRLVPLWLGDRNYYSYNSLCHLNEAGHRFVLRMRDDHVEGLLGRGAVPEGCFDVTVERVLVRTRSVAARTRPDRPEIYRWVDSRRRFDAIGELNWHAEYPMTLRVVRRRLPRRDGDGNDAQMHDDPADYTLSDRCTEEQRTRMDDFTRRFLPLYIAFMSNSNHNAYDNYARVSPYLLPGSDLESRFYNAIAGQEWSHSLGDVLHDVVVNGVFELENGRFLIDVDYMVDTTANGGIKTENAAGMLIVAEDQGAGGIFDSELFIK